MADGLYLTPEDRDKLDAMYRSQRPPHAHPTPEDHHHLSPEVYVARPAKDPDTGDPGSIPALETGTSNDFPGCWPCDIYQIVLSSDEDHDWELQAITNLNFPVYNLTKTAISSDWILVVRDKGGSWIAAVRQTVQMAWGTTTAAVASGDASFRVSGLTPADGSTWGGSGNCYVSNNPNGWKLASGANVLLMYGYCSTGMDSNTAHNNDSTTTNAPSGWNWRMLDGPWTC